MKILSKLNLNWKEYSIILSVLLLILVIGILIGVTATGVDTLRQIVVNTISGLIVNAPWLIIILIGFGFVGKSIKDASRSIVEKMPEWLLKYEDIAVKRKVIERAISNR